MDLFFQSVFKDLRLIIFVEPKLVSKFDFLHVSEFGFISNLLVVLNFCYLRHG